MECSPRQSAVLLAFLAHTTAAKSGHANGGCFFNQATHRLGCRDIDFGSNASIITKRHGSNEEHITRFEVEVAAYERLQAVRRPVGCEGFVLFPQMLSEGDNQSITMQRFGSPIGCMRDEECCEDMCSSLPVHGPTGLCQQLACIGAVMRLAKVTHLDMQPKNTLYGMEPLTEGGPSVSQVALFDFDVAVGERTCEQTCGAVMRVSSFS